MSSKNHDTILFSLFFAYSVLLVIMFCNYTSLLRSSLTAYIPNISYYTVNRISNNHNMPTFLPPRAGPAQ